MSLTKATFDFLALLEKNNNRDWFMKHKPRYEQAREEMKALVQAIVEGLATFDPAIHRDIDPNRCLFRIYRDVRFRKDKTPYKTWLGAGISVNGRKLQGPEYYLHVQPGKSFLAVGYWRPEKEHLAAIRQEIDYQGTEFRDILSLINQSVEQPIILDDNDRLVRPPSGYSATHPEIEFIKLKSFTLSVALPDTSLYDPQAGQAARTILDIYRALYPFKLFLHRAIGDE